MAKKKSAVRGALAPIPKTKTSTQSSSTTKRISIAKAEPPEKNEGEAAAPYAEALSRLEPLQPILAGLAHRNHNQHRRAAWWRHFGILRRNSARLAEDLVSAVEVARRNAVKATRAAKAKSKKRRREELVSRDLGTGTGTGGKDDAEARGVGASVEIDENVARHAAWVRDVLVPKCYLAFSQLAADPQFAPLGVVLLGVLAQIQAACDIAAPVPQSPSPSTRGIPEAAAPRPSDVENATSTLKAGNTAGPGAKMDESRTARGGKEEDRDERGGGKAISREAVEQNKGKETGEIEAQTAGKIAGPTDRAKKDTPPPEASAAIALLPTGKRQVSFAREGGGDQEVHRPAKKMKAAAVTRDGEKGMHGDKDKKKNKKAKKGDEFDDLFKDLL